MTLWDMLLGWAKRRIKSLLKPKSNPGITIHMAEHSTLNWNNYFDINVSDNQTFKLPKPPEEPEEPSERSP